MSVAVNESGGEEESGAVDDGAAFERRFLKVDRGRGGLERGDLSSDELQRLGFDGLGRLGIDDGRVCGRRKEGRA